MHSIYLILLFIRSRLTSLRDVYEVLIYSNCKQFDLSELCYCVFWEKRTLYVGIISSYVIWLFYVNYRGRCALHTQRVFPSQAFTNQQTSVAYNRQITSIFWELVLKKALYLYQREVSY